MSLGSSEAAIDGKPQPRLVQRVDGGRQLVRRIGESDDTGPEFVIRYLQLVAGTDLAAAESTVADRGQLSPGGGRGTRDLRSRPDQPSILPAMVLEIMLQAGQLDPPTAAHRVVFVIPGGLRAVTRMHQPQQRAPIPTLERVVDGDARRFLAVPPLRGATGGLLEPSRPQTAAGLPLLNGADTFELGPPAEPDPSALPRLNLGFDREPASELDGIRERLPDGLR